MFGLFKDKRIYPDYWQRYIQLFEGNQPKIFGEATFVIFDTETTGLNTNKDRILSIGALSVRDGAFEVKDIFEIYVRQEYFDSETVKIHQIRQNHSYEKIEELEAMKQFLGYMKNSILVGHHIGFDMQMCNKALKRMGLPRLRNQCMDTQILYNKTKIFNKALNEYPSSTSLDDVAKELSVQTYDRHTATGDALITYQVFFKILSKLGVKENTLIKKYLCKI